MSRSRSFLARLCRQGAPDRRRGLVLSVAEAIDGATTPRMKSPAVAKSCPSPRHTNTAPRYLALQNRIVSMNRLPGAPDRTGCDPAPVPNRAGARRGISQSSGGRVSLFRAKVTRTTRSSGRAVAGRRICDPHDHCPVPIRGIRSQRRRQGSDRRRAMRTRPGFSAHKRRDARRAPDCTPRRLLWSLEEGSAADQAYLNVGRDAQPGQHRFELSAPSGVSTLPPRRLQARSCSKWI